MIIADNISSATFIKRNNRFLGQVNLNGEEVQCFIPDPGRWKELLYKGKKVKVYKHTFLPKYWHWHPQEEITKYYCSKEIKEDWEYFGEFTIEEIELTAIYESPISDVANGGVQIYLINDKGLKLFVEMESYHSFNFVK